MLKILLIWAQEEGRTSLLEIRARGMDLHLVVAETCPTVVWKAELTSNESESIAKETVQERFEGSA